MSESQPVMPARPARDAYDAFGMNTHLGFQNPQNTNRFTEETVDLLLALGVGRVRQRISCEQNRSQAATRAGLSRLMAAGVKVCAPTLIGADATSLDTARARMDLYLDEIEANADSYDLRLIDAMPGLNEPNGDKRGGRDWAQQTRWAQQALFERVRARSAFDHVMVQGPPLNRRGGRGKQGAAAGRRAHRRGGLRRRGTRQETGRPDRGFAAVLSADAEEIGDLSAWADCVDLHIYPGDQDSFNGGPPQAFMEAVRGMYHSPLPVVVTESGWSNCSPDDPGGQDYSGGGKSCPESVTAKYAPKAPLNALLLGHEAVYAYVILENQPPYADGGHALRSSKYGYIRTPELEPATWAPKAQFHAMRRYLALFADPGPSFEPVGLPLAVEARCPDLQWMLFQRRTGQHLLALWRTADLYSCDRRTNAGRYLDVEPAAVTLTLDRDRPIELYQPSTQDAPTRTGNSATCTVDVSDELLVLTIG